jgi:hypothetical protein
MGKEFSMLTARRIVPCLLVFSLLAFQVPCQGGDSVDVAQTTQNGPAVLLEGIQIDTSVPRPQEVLGFEPGFRASSSRDIATYLRQLAEASPRVKFNQYGMTYEGRELSYVTISSEQNLKRLNEIKAAVSRLANPRMLSQTEAEKLIKETPGVAWLEYSIHGDELSGADAALFLAYYLAAAEDSLTRAVRDKLIVLIDPNENPDGRERFLAQLAQWLSTKPNPDVQSIEHTGVWPWGRGNHYLFDLNRDWFTFLFPETRARAKVILEWHPQVVVDAHEMGEFDTFMFSPPREPYNPNATASLKKWLDIFSKEQARALDRFGWSYYRREWNEEWFPGYANVWASHTGAIGILYEQAGVQATLVKRPDGTILGYPEAVSHHVVSSIANLATAASHKNELLGDYYKEKRNALDAGGAARAFVISPGNNSTRARELVSVLLRNGIEVELAKGSFVAHDLKSAYGEKHSSKKFLPGTYVVFLAQPSRQLLKAIFEFDPRMSTSFLEEERRELEKRGETRLYEVSAWSLPMAFDVEAYEAGSVAPVKTEKLGSAPGAGETGGKQPGQGARGTNEARETIKTEGAGRNEGGEKTQEEILNMEEPEQNPGEVKNPEATFGFLLDCSDDSAVKALARLFERECKVRAALKPFKIEGVSFPLGTLLIPLKGNADKIPLILEEIARETGARFLGVNTALTEEGIDLGGRYFRLLQQPRIAVMTGARLDFTSFGTLWYLLDRRYGYRFSSLDVNRLGELDLDKYNVIILPSVYGEPDRYTELLGKKNVAKLKRWVEGNGTLICIGTAAAFAADTATALSQVRLRSQALGILDQFEEALLREDRIERKEKVDSLAVWEGGDGVSARKKTGARERASEAAPGAEEKITSGVEEKPSSVGPKARAEEAIPGKPDIEKLKREDEWLKRFMPRGTILRAELDNEHWLASGLGKSVPVILYDPNVFLSKPPVETPCRLSEAKTLRLSGLLWPEARKRWARGAYATREGLGRGQIILFAGEPYFRGYFHGSGRMLANAIFLGPGMGTSVSVPW